MRYAGILLAAFLAGAAGLGLEALLLSTAGVALGFSRAGALGLAVFLAGWALGAFLAGRSKRAPARSLLALGAAVALVSWLAPRWLLAIGRGEGGPALLGALVALLLVALPQGAFLPLLVRSRGAVGRRGIAALFSSNLLGSVLGAHAISFWAVARWGRLDAALCAGGIALTAGSIGSLAARSVKLEAERRSWPDARGLPLSAWQAGWIAGVGTLWLGGLEWIALRLGVLWLGGMENALAAVLAASMLALSAGAAVLPLALARSRDPLGSLVIMALVCSSWFFLCPQALAELGQDSPLFLRALLLCGPALFPFGGLIPVLHRRLEGEGGRRLGDLLLHEAWGALIGIPLVHELFVPHFGLGGATGLLGLCAALCLCSLRFERRSVLVGSGLSLVFVLFAMTRPEPALQAPPLARPTLNLRAFEEDREFCVAVVDDGLNGERTLLTDGFRAAGTGRAYRYMRTLGHLPLLLHAAPRRVAVLALGTGTSLGSVSLHPEVLAIDVLEISPAVVRQAPWFETVNRGALDGSDLRVRLRIGDGRRSLASAPGSYDVITMEPLLPDSPFGVYLYTREFYARARTALAPGGLVCQWVPPHALEPESFDAVVSAFCDSFAWSSLWLFGTQVILLGGERRPDLDAGRFPEEGSELFAALAALGLQDPAGLAARYLAEGDSWKSIERPLTDADPWVIYRPRRRGKVLLADLPNNLASLGRVEGPLPEDWARALGELGEGRRRGLSALRRARLSFALEDARLVGLTPAVPELPPPSESLRLAGELAGSDPALAELSEERRFLDALRAGVGALQLARDADAARSAVRHLTEALELRGERADGHLYMAVALDRLGESQVAERALGEALRRCPRLMQSAVGERARNLGLRAELLSAAREWVREQPVGEGGGPRGERP